MNSVAIFDFDYIRNLKTVSTILGLRLNPSSKEYNEISKVFNGVNKYLSKKAEQKVESELEDLNERENKENIKKCKDIYYD